MKNARPGPVWDPLRLSLAAMGCVLWGLYLLLFRRGYTYWLLDILFSILALCLWLGRGRAVTAGRAAPGQACGAEKFQVLF